MIEIIWLGHGTFQLKLESGEIVLIDPWINGNPKSPQGFKIDHIDTMLITHGHFDHVADAVQLAKKFKPKVIANFEICAWLETKGVQNTGGMNKGGSQTAGSLKVTMTHALHSSGIQDGTSMLYGGEAAGFILHFADGSKAYFAGDTSVFSDMALYRELYAPDLAFLPIGDHNPPARKHAVTGRGTGDGHPPKRHNRSKRQAQGPRTAFSAGFALEDDIRAD